MQTLYHHCHWHWHPHPSDLCVKIEARYEDTNDLQQNVKIVFDSEQEKDILSDFCDDRFGNVLVFEEINRLSREILIKTKDTVQKSGYELIYADTDSVFIKKSNAITKATYSV